MRTPLGPNPITILSIAIGIGAGFLFSRGTAWTAFGGALAYLLACLLDECDGHIARAKNLSSRLGEWLDMIGDYVTDLSLFSGIALGMSHHGHGPNELWIVWSVCFLGLTLHFFVTLIEKKRGF